MRSQTQTHKMRLQSVFFCYDMTMNILNLNRLLPKSGISPTLLSGNIVSILIIVSLIVPAPVFSEDTKSKAPATGPLSPGMKKLPPQEGIITDFPLVPSNIIKQAGYILTMPESEGSIIDNQAKLERFGAGDLVYIDAGSERSVSPGDRFAIVRHDKFIYHPVIKTSSGFAESVKDLKDYSWGSLKDFSWGTADDGKPLGYLVRILGELEVLEVDKDIAKAMVTESYEDMIVGDRIIPTITPPILLDIREREDKNIEGYIVASKIASTSLAMTDVVYLDVGQEQNVALGDHFSVHVFPETPSGDETLPQSVGELLIVNAQNDTSTAVVLKGSDELKIGRKVRYKK